MNRRNLISLSIALVFSVLSITGLLLYLVKHNHITTSLHIVFGLLFLSFVGFHIFNNWPSLSNYVRQKGNLRLKPEFILSFTVIGIFLVGTWLNLPPFSLIDEWGDKIRGAGKKKKEKGIEKKQEGQLSFEQLYTNASLPGKSLKVIIEKKEATASLSIWAEDSLHSEALFIPNGPDEAPQDAFASVSMRMRQPPPPNYKASPPTGNFILYTHITPSGITPSGPLRIKALARKGEMTEMYEQVISTAHPGAYTLHSVQDTHKLLQSAIVVVE